ncbi:MAG: DUF5666 domain-containing protein [Patescibacteria group bacterium]|nr:DUF5666 domain-containing protein [Patescibacteria group bacterium]
MTKQIVIIAAVAVVAFGAGIGADRLMKGNQPNPRLASGQFGAQGQRDGNGGTSMRQRFGNGGMIAGEITANDGQSLTVKTRDGGSRIVILPTTVKVGKSVDATLEDLTVGAAVTVVGSSNQDGSVTAENVQIGTGFQLRGPAGQPPSTAPSDEQPTPPVR